VTVKRRARFRVIRSGSLPKWCKKTQSLCREVAVTAKVRAKGLSRERGDPLCSFYLKAMLFSLINLTTTTHWVEPDCGSSQGSR